MKPFIHIAGSLLAVTLLIVSPSFAAPVAPCKVVAKLPHSTENYTEGFFYRDGHFYEGTGREGHSSLIITEPATGKVLQRHDLPSTYFGEGIVDWHDNLLEWTWQSHTGFILDRVSLRIIGQFHYDGEGWGMTRTATELITSDGSAILRFRNPDTFDKTRQIVVRDGDRPVQQLNELEFVDGEIYANIWHSDRIARISPKDGRVLGWIDCTGLLDASQKIDAESVLNGIAYDAQHHRLFVTGKQWPNIFEIRVPTAR
ncbi:MAG: glutaminyl-peptide cyclotransferase [Acidobacteria bacterium]|nr:glutaminyl-peptide cyclotransferase [Acidobacteriota bacterium]